MVKYVFMFIGSFLVRILAYRPLLGLVNPPLEPATEGGIEALTQKISDRLQSQIAKYPDQWFVFTRIEEGLSKAEVPKRGVEPLWA